MKNEFQIKQENLFIENCVNNRISPMKNNRKFCVSYKQKDKAGFDNDQGYKIHISFGTLDDYYKHFFVLANELCRQNLTFKFVNPEIIKTTSFSPDVEGTQSGKTFTIYLDKGDRLIFNDTIKELTSGAEKRVEGEFKL